MLNFYFTFAKIHTTESGESLRGCYCIVRAVNIEEAKKKMFATRGYAWSGVYSSKEKAGVNQYKLVKVQSKLIDLWSTKRLYAKT